MRTARLVRRHGRAQAGLLLLLAVVAAVVAGALTVGVGYADASAREGLRSALRDADAQAAAVQVHTRVSADLPAQLAAADETFDAALGELPVTTTTSLRSVALPAAAAGRPLGQVALGALDPGSGSSGLPAAVRVTAGDWPAAGGGTGVPTAVHASAAEALGLRVGDRLSVTGDGGATVDLVVAALWLPERPGDPRWFADPLMAGGVDPSGEQVHGPFLVEAEVLAGAPWLTLVRWVVVPDLSVIDPGVGRATAAAVEELDTRLGTDPVVAVRGLVVAGGLVGTLQAVEASLTAVRGVTAAALAVVALAGWVALDQTARLLAADRLPHVALLRSRGTSGAQLAALAAVEGVAVVTPAAALGALVGWAALGGSGDVRPAAVVAVGVSAAAVVDLVVLALRQAGAPQAGAADLAGRTGPAAAAVLPVGLALAAVAWWQLDRYGSPTFTGVGGRPQVDPLAAAAPPLVVLSVALAAAALIAPLAGVLGARSARRAGLSPVLELRQLARRAPVHAVPVVLVALATATAVLTSAYVGTVQAERGVVTRLATGPDVRVELGGAAASDPGGPGPTGSFRELAGVVAAGPALTLPFTAGTQAGELVAPSAAVLATLDPPPAAGLPGSWPPAGPGVGTPVAAGTTALRLSADSPAGSRLRGWLADPAGDVVLLEGTGPAAPGGPGGLSLDVPAGGPWRLLALDVVGGSTDPDRVDLTTVPPGGAQAGQWSAVDAGDGVVRLVPGRPAEVAVPVLADQRLVELLDLEVGGSTILRVADLPLEVRVEDVVAAVPGAGPAPAVLADLLAVQDAVLRSGGDPVPASSVWLSTDAPEDVAALAARQPSAVAVATAVPDADPLTAPAPLAFWLAAVSAAALAVPGAGAAVLTLARARRREGAVLRALGLGAAAQVAARRRELGTALAVGVGTGLLGGVLAAWLLTGPLVRSTVRPAGAADLPVTLRADLPAAGLLALTLAAALAVLLAVHGRQVRREVAGATVREDS